MSDTELIDYLSKRWDKTGLGSHLFGVKFSNPTRNLTLREAVMLRIEKDSKPFERGKAT